MERRAEGRLILGDIAIDPVTREVTVREKAVTLSAKEFDLLTMLARSPGRPFSRATILARVWGWGFEGTERTVDNFILSLRQKIEAEAFPGQPAPVSLYNTLTAAISALQKTMIAYNVK